MTKYVPVTEIVDTPEGRDEYGTSDEFLERCEAHDVIYREGGVCLACKREEEDDE